MYEEQKCNLTISKTSYITTCIHHEREKNIEETKRIHSFEMSFASTNNDEQKAYHILRISDIVDEPLGRLPSLPPLEDVPLVSLENAVQSLMSFLPTIENYVQLAKQRCKNPPTNGLTLDQSASILLYSIGWKPHHQCLHMVLNTILRSNDRSQLQPWLLYLKLLHTGLSQLPSIHQNIYRGVKLDLSKEYPVGQIFTWWSFSSCTSLINILQSDQFFNMNDDRTLFTIESFSGKDIRQHSYYQIDEEILCLPGTKLQVEANFKQNNGIHSIRLQEISSPSEGKSKEIFAEENGVYAGGEEEGNGLNQLHYPSAVCVDDDDNIYIADSRNHRIIKWKSEATEGRVVAGGNEQGNRTNQLSWPSDVILDKRNDCLIIADKDNRRVVRWPCQNGQHGEVIIDDIDCYGLALDKNGDLYVSNKEKHEVRRWKIGETSGTLIAGGRGQGKRLDQLNSPAFIFVDEDLSLYVSDFWNHRVVKWLPSTNEGIVVAGSHCRGNSLKQLSNPQGLLVDHHGTIYIADCGNDRVVCWPQGATEGTIIAGGNDNGETSKQFEHPFGLALHRDENLYIVDHDSHLIQRFTIHQNSN